MLASSAKMKIPVADVSLALNKELLKVNAILKQKGYEPISKADLRDFVILDDWQGIKDWVYDKITTYGP